MTTLGLKAGDVVLLLERRGEQVLVHRALVVRCTMDPALVGLHGEAAIEAAYVQPPQEWPATESLPRRLFPVVHHTHLDCYRPYAQHFSYEELPSPPTGVCRFCGCTRCGRSLLLEGAAAEL